MKGEKCICFHDQKKRLRSLTGKDINIKNGLWKEEEIKVADNKWSMIFTPSPEFYTIYRAGFRRIWIVLVFSLIVSVLVALYLEELLSHTAKVEEEVKNKTYELNESNKMLYEANDKLKKLDKIKSDFVSNVSHEVKNPLSIIKMSVDSILDGDSGEIDERQKGPLGMIRRNVERLLRLVTDILDISKIEAGEMKLKIEQVDVASLVSEIIHDYEIEIKQKQFTVRTDFQNDLGLVQADKDKLSEVIINLLNNAIKYTPSGGNILIKLASDENGIRFEISDNGQGIAKENLEKIFDKFERVTAEKQEGTGLGLPIARDIILLHKGKLWVESELGKGSKFIFTLPYKMTS
jgi:signal transduction histidine kinase